MSGLGDIESARLLAIKGLLFVFLGLLAAALLIARDPAWETAALLAIAIWAFARAYYFAFYVVEHYVDGEFKFAGLGAFLAYYLRRRGQQGE